MTLITARLVGSDAAPGVIAASDVARIITGLERAIARAAYVVLRARRRGTGRHAQTIEAAARLTFVAVREGSLVEVLRLPEASVSDGELPFPVAHLSQLAFARLVRTITVPDDSTDARLAAAIHQLAGELGIGDRNESITLTSFEDDDLTRPIQSATVDAPIRMRMQALATPPPHSISDTVVGTLVEADFESRTARLRTADASAVAIRFPESLADDIQEALRTRSTLQGDIRYDSRTLEALSVDLRAVVTGTQLAAALAADDFWRERSFAELQQEQGVNGLIDVDAPAFSNLTDEDGDAFVAAAAAM